MRVIHLSRTFLHRTETFIYTQLTHLPPEKAIVLARDWQHQDCFPNVNVRAFCLGQKTWHKRWSGICYRVFRHMTDYERQYYLSEIYNLSPDLLHVHFAVDAAYFFNVWKQVNRPIVVSCYGYDVSSFPNRYLGWGKHYLEPVWRYANLILAMSNDMREDLLRLNCPDDKIRIHYHGINLVKFQYKERNLTVYPIRIIFVGSLTERKGVLDILRAFIQITKQRPQVELRFVGDGYLRTRLEQMALDWGVENRVSFAGFVPHEKLKDEFYLAHIFCHPSKTLKSGDKEGIPGTIIEAMTTGLPVVTTRHAGIPEMVRNGEDGFVVAEGDINSIYQALLTLIDNPKLRVDLGRNAAIHAQQKADAVYLTKELESIYKDLLDV